jgi:hypothetical protein
MTCDELEYEIEVLRNRLKSKKEIHAKAIKEIKTIIDKADITLKELVNGLESTSLK